MERYAARFERNRGHFLVVEGDPPFTRGDCDEFQLRMLQACDVPGLMKPSVEEIDGRLAFRYALQGGRMLSQAMRTAKWSMMDWMSAVCRLADVIEECRLYLLDAERLRLDDDWMFVGEGWHDLRLVYLPMSEAAKPIGGSLERLIVRWMMQVAELEGPVVQKVIRLVSSPEFTADSLRRYARGYLAEKAGSGIGGTGGTSGTEVEGSNVRYTSEEGIAEWSGNGVHPNLAVERINAQQAIPNPPSGDGWRWFRPTREEPQQLSGLLGIDPAPIDEEPYDRSENNSETLGRRRIWLTCASIGLSAVAWRWGFAEHPGTSGLLFSGGVTLVMLAGAIWFWNWRTQQDSETRFGVQEAEGWGAQAVLPSMAEPAMPYAMPTSIPLEERLSVEETGRLGSSWQADMTQQLDNPPHKPVKVSYYMEWESARPPVRIPLQEASVVIGRSLEAAKHVDETHGVSRAHVELIQTQDGWKAKDLGSRNGTRLNETPMVPYEAYTLQPEDCLWLADSRYRFKRSS